MRSLLIILVLLWTPALAQAQGNVSTVEAVSPEIEQRARELGRTLRCVVCQNQSIEESDAELAADMRRLVREQLQAGATDAEVTASMRARYGDYVLLKPPLQRNTLVLWFAPMIALGLGLIWFLTLRRRVQVVTPEALSDDEKARLEALRRR